MKKAKTVAKRLLCLALATAVSCAAAGCGGAGTTSATGSAASAASAAVSDSKIVNIGVTDSLASLNPLTIDATEINKNATAMMFLPLVELNSKMQFEGMLADSITTKDNKTFTIHVNSKAAWSDGKSVTADDVAFTVLR
ncbi:MAG: ABC transporter substrate-binding protein, partial [Oscillospiraceae bacterium]|nr:ABC transporter substrate-binding protein [Oscillospiraceae bacterium]